MFSLRASAHTTPAPQGNNGIIPTSIDIEPSMRVGHFDFIARVIKDDDGNTIEVWYARELQQVLGYARRENFSITIYRTMESCKTLGINLDDHSRKVTKMTALAKGTHREVQDFMLTRYAYRLSEDCSNLWHLGKLTS